MSKLAIGIILGLVFGILYLAIKGWALYFAAACWVASSFLQAVFLKEWFYSGLSALLAVALFHWAQSG